MPGPDDGTTSAAYTTRLETRSVLAGSASSSERLPWNCARLLGDRRTLDVGCGIGRNLAHLRESVGVDHNAASSAGLRGAEREAFTVTDFPGPEAEPRW